jgi:hypothetical protein
VPPVAFAHPTRARLPLGPAHAGVYVTTLQASRDVADWPVACPLSGTSLLRFDDGLSPAARSRPGVSPDRTHTGWLR